MLPEVAQYQEPLRYLILFVNMEKFRFNQLIESKLGTVKPLLVEESETSADECNVNIAQSDETADAFWDNFKKSTLVKPYDYNSTVRFQKWVKKNYPSINLGTFGIKKDGVDGKFGKLTQSAWNRVGNEYLKGGSQTNHSLTYTINEDIKRSISKARNEYLKWFSDENTRKKFKNQKLIPQLLKYINTLTSYKSYYNKNQSPNPKTFGWVKYAKSASQLNELKYKSINLNVFNIHNGKNYIASLDQVTKHEMGHLIDNFLRIYKEPTYILTQNTPTSQQEYSQTYITNDSETYSRLNNFRTIIEAGPMDDGNQMLNKFFNKIRSGTIQVKGFDLSALYSSTKPRKASVDQANEIMKSLRKMILVNGLSSHNTQQLFSEYGIQSQGNIYVSFYLLGRLNQTSKGPEDENKKSNYLYLKFTPSNQSV